MIHQHSTEIHNRTRLTQKCVKQSIVDYLLTNGNNYLSVTTCFIGYKCLRLLIMANVSMMSSKDNVDKTSFSMLNNSRAVKRLSVIVLRSFDLIKAILLNDRSPEQLDTIRDM
jgi:hypothetical protein